VQGLAGAVAAAATQAPLEAAAVVLAIAYLLLAIRENIWCWACAAGSTALWVYVTFAAQLYMEAALNGFYFAMALYGWYSWTSGRPGGSGLPVSTWPLRLHAIAIAAIVAAGLASGALLVRYTDAAWPYVDSMTTFASVWATFLVARKVFENWWYWLAIDAVAVFMYWSRDLPLMALLFVLYVCMIPFGLISWHHSLRARPQ